MQPLAAWLVSRPQNAVLGLAATYILFLPLAGIFSGALIVLLVLQHGVRRALIQALVKVNQCPGDSGQQHDQGRLFSVNGDRKQ